MDLTFCKFIADRTSYTVMDVGHRLGPEDPFPAALNDTEDAIKYILARPDEYDISRISLSGNSSGANITMAAAAILFPKGTIHSLIAFYPMIDLATDPWQKTAPEKGEQGTASNPPWVFQVFHAAYAPPGIDRKDPRVSPIFADPSAFPQNVLIVTAGRDELTPESEALGEKLKQTDGRNVVIKRFENCGHGWDKHPNGDVQLSAAKEAYQLTVDFLRNT